MSTRLKNVWAVVCAGALVGLTAGQHRTFAHEDNTTALVADDASGIVRTVNLNGPLDLNNPFFKELGTNGRSCFSCHRPAQGWSITPESVQGPVRRIARPRSDLPHERRVELRRGRCLHAGQAPGRLQPAPHAGLIRIGIDVPIGAEFVIESVDDPYHCGAPLTAASMYRRPLPSTNLRFLTAVMWDGRESSPTTTVLQDLAHQANDATLGHAQASLHLTTQEAQDIVTFETGLFTAQVRDDDAGPLRADGASGGPVALSQQPFFIGINDPVGLNPTGAPFDPNAFTIFNAWSHSAGRRHHDDYGARRAIARGQQIFNTKPIVITGVAGLNNQTFSNGVTVPDPFTGTCTTCHDTPNAGDHSVKAPLNIGLTDASRRTADMPLYTLRRLSNGETVKTTDPGRAMITGKWADVGKFKGPILRALAARAPYFHNGFASTLDAVVDFYETRFGIGLTAREKADLAAFLFAPCKNGVCFATSPRRSPFFFVFGPPQNPPFPLFFSFFPPRPPWADPPRRGGCVFFIKRGGRWPVTGGEPARASFGNPRPPVNGRRRKFIHIWGPRVSGSFGSLGVGACVGNMDRPEQRRHPAGRARLHVSGAGVRDQHRAVAGRVRHREHRDLRSQYQASSILVGRVFQLGAVVKF